MGEAGYNMGRVRWAEFAKHVRGLESNMMVVSKYGELKFSGDLAYSYEMLIGKVWPLVKVIVWNQDALNNSRTTLVHARAVTNAAFELKDYFFLPARTKDMMEDPTQIVMDRWKGHDLTITELHDVIDFCSFLRSNEKTNKDLDPLMVEYVNGNQDKRDAMRGIFELQREKV